MDHISYHDERLEGETNNDRLWIIAKQSPANDYEFHQAKIMALYWYNHQRYGCEYNIAIHRRLKLYAS